MMIRLLVASIIALLVVAAMVTAHNQKPMLIDAAAPMAAPQMLLSPCPLTPRNLPTRDTERRA